MPQPFTHPLLSSLLPLLRQNPIDESQLIDLLGYDDLDTLQYILQNAYTILQENPNTINEEDNGNQELRKDTSEQQITQYDLQINTKANKSKGKGKAKTRTKHGANISSLQQNTNAVYADSTNTFTSQSISDPANRLGHPVAKRDNVNGERTYQNIYAAQKNIEDVIFGQTTLPEGTKRYDSQFAEEYVLPINRQHEPKLQSYEFVPITKLEQMHQSAFSHESLNVIQSIVFETVYNTSENMLVCAPTGAGKTDIGILAIIKALPGKVVYIAPMKALAAEITEKFRKRIKNYKVREWTGDMQLTPQEVHEADVLLMTPEKFDVVTRRAEADLLHDIRLLILDEVHLLNEERGAVLEVIVARILRQVELSQRMIRIVGLSATLPNYLDVAMFLKVNLNSGLFYFDASFRPVPLEQHFIGVKGKGKESLINMNRQCFEKLQEQVEHMHQVMIFVHSRKDTVKTAKAMCQIIEEEGVFGQYECSMLPVFGNAQRDFNSSHNRELQELFPKGFAVHHAGMSRSDRTLVEKWFAAGAIQVLVCTATLAWGVNLPAHAVIIKGTSIYDQTKGIFTDLSVLDVLQIFGRAGRPQFEKEGIAYLLTPQARLAHYLMVMTDQAPIESNFLAHIADYLNAEIAAGTVKNLSDGIAWLGDTYLFIRMRKNPMVYGIKQKEVNEDPDLIAHRTGLVDVAAMYLRKHGMIRYSPQTTLLESTLLGKAASEYYIQAASIEVFEVYLKPSMTEADALCVISLASEFEQLQIRDEESVELEVLEHQCVCQIRGGPMSVHGKANILMQCMISKIPLENQSLHSDMNYISQNAGRIARALFQIVLHRSWSTAAQVFLTICKCISSTLWPFENPLMQFDNIQHDVLNKLTESEKQLSDFRSMTLAEIGKLIKFDRLASFIHSLIWTIPVLKTKTTMRPLTNTLIQVDIYLTADWNWDDKWNGRTEYFHVWIEDPATSLILRYEMVHLKRSQQQDSAYLRFVFSLPSPRPNILLIRILSDKWIGGDMEIQHSLTPIRFPEENSPVITPLHKVQKISTSRLPQHVTEALLEGAQHFNEAQSLVFSSIWDTNDNVLMGAPLGCGKPIIGMLAIAKCNTGKAVYLKSTISKLKSWQNRLRRLGKTVEIIDEGTTDISVYRNSDVILSTPAAWTLVSDTFSSSDWQQLECVVADDIHTICTEEAAIYELVLSQLRNISSKATSRLRLVVMSSTLYNPRDVAHWLGISTPRIYNFDEKAKNIVQKIVIQTFTMSISDDSSHAMIKTTYSAMSQIPMQKQILIFATSIVQAEKAAELFMKLSAIEEKFGQFRNASESEAQQYSLTIRNSVLKRTLMEGIALYHNRLKPDEAKLSLETFRTCTSRVLIVVRGTTLPTDVRSSYCLFMGTSWYQPGSSVSAEYTMDELAELAGHAAHHGDTEPSSCIILCSEDRKPFYEKMWESCMLESSARVDIALLILHQKIDCRRDFIELMKGTFWWIRLEKNPSYYGCNAGTPEAFFSQLIDKVISNLIKRKCITFLDRNTDRAIQRFAPSSVFRICSIQGLGIDDIPVDLEESMSEEQIVTSLRETTIDVKHVSAVLPSQRRIRKGKSIDNIKDRT